MFLFLSFLFIFFSLPVPLILFSSWTQSHPLPFNFFSLPPLSPTQAPFLPLPCPTSTHLSSSTRGWPKPQAEPSTITTPPSSWWISGLFGWEVWISGFSGDVDLCGWVVLIVWCGFWLWQWQWQWLGWWFVDWVVVVGYRSVCSMGLLGFSWLWLWLCSGFHGSGGSFGCCLL